MQKINVAIIGAGPGCLAIMDRISSRNPRHRHMHLVGVADSNPEAAGIKKARLSKTYTTSNYRDLFNIPKLDLVIELTGDPELSLKIQHEKPHRVQVMDHKMARLFWDLNRLDNERPQTDEEIKKRSPELQASEKEVLRQKKTAEGIIYGSPIPMLVIDKNHKIAYWNKACERLTGFSSKEMIGTDRQWEPFYPHKRKTLADLIIDGDAETIWNLYKDMKLRKSPMVERAYEAEHFFPHLGPEGTHLYFNAAPIKDDKGNIQGAIVTYQDFSERVLMTQKIKRREAFVQNLIQNSIDGIIATGPKGNIRIFNSGAARILGYAPDEITGKMTYSEILSGETGQAIRESFYSDRYGPEGKIINMEVNLLNKAKEPIPVRFSGTLLYEQEKEVGSVVFIQDLKEVHKLQKEKEQAQRMAAIGSTVAGVAHYIKNILTGLQGGAYVINSAISKKDLGLVVKGWDMVDRNIKQIGAIVNDMLIYSRQRTPDYQKINPNELASEVLEMMDQKAKIAGVTLVRDLQPGIPKVSMDRTGIHNSLLNLISNAIDSCTLEGIVNGKGMVTVKTDRPSGGGVAFIIRDNGTGMDEETQKKLFTDFFTTKGYKGTGLGLPVTKKIAEEHGGTLTFKTSLGEGTVFTLMIPEKRVEADGNLP